MTEIGTAAASQFAGWLNAFNSGKRAEMLTYHDANFPYDKAGADVAGIDRELGLSQFTGGFDFKRAEESAATRLVAILKERDSDQFARAAMDVDPEPPHQVLKFEIDAIPTPDDLRPGRMEERDAIAALVTEVDRAMQRDWFSGAVLIAKNRQAVFAEAFGFADRAAKRPNTLDGSIRATAYKAARRRARIRPRWVKLESPEAETFPCRPSYPTRWPISRSHVHHVIARCGKTPCRNS